MRKASLLSRDMDSRFEIITTTTAFYLCLGFVCIFLEAGQIERQIAVSTRDAAAEAGLLWVAVEADGQHVALRGAAETEDARQQALALAQQVAGVGSITNHIELVEGATICQSALNQKLEAGIAFDSGRTEISEESFSVLQDLANVAAQCPGALEVAVHTSARGDAEVNRKLAQRRADNIARYLIRAGVPASKLVASGVGEDQPMAGTADDVDERIEIRVRSSLA